MKHRIAFIGHRLVVPLLFLPNLLAAQADPGLVATNNGQSLWGLIQQGGWAMWPLGLCSLLMLFLTLYGWRETALKQFLPDAILTQTSQLLRTRDLAGAQQLLQSNNCVLSRAMCIGLGKAKPDRADANKVKVELMVSESLEAEENQVAQWVTYLNVVATVAPMIGLLGTVSGMISAFETISQGGMGRPELLAGDIGEALITTATGLVIGIPAMVAYFILKNRLGNRMLATLQAANNLIDDLTEGSE